MRKIAKKIDGYYSEQHGMITVTMEYEVDGEWAEEIVINHKNSLGNIIKQENLCKLYNRILEVK